MDKFSRNVITRRGTLRLTLATGLLAWGAAQCPVPAADEQPQPTCTEVAAGYTKYVQITKDRVFVDPELAAVCIGVTQAAVEAARVTKGPHANAAVLIFMNTLAARAFAEKATAYPVGSVVVKQKEFMAYRATPPSVKALSEPALASASGAASLGNGETSLQLVVHGSPTGVGGMIKRPAGYDPEHGDWEYFYFEQPTKIEHGKITSCVQCHTAAKSSDFVFGSWQ